MLGQGVKLIENLVSIFQRSDGLSENSLQQAGPDALQLISWAEWKRPRNEVAWPATGDRPYLVKTQLCFV